MNPELIQEIIRLANEFRAHFSPPEFIPGCLVKSITDIDEYSTNNGWVEAVCGRHNQQQVRWKSSEAVAINDYIDVLFFPDRRTFEAYGLGGTTSIPTPGGGAWPLPSVWTISTVSPDADFPDIATAIASGSVGLRDGLVLDAEQFSSASSTDLSLLIMTLSGGLGQPEITSSVSNDFTLKISNAGNVLRYLQVAHTAAGALAGCIKSNQDGSVYDHVRTVKTSGAATVAAGIYIYGGNSSGHIIQDCDISVAAGTTKYGVLVDTAASTVVIEGGQISAATADIRVDHASATVKLKGVQLLGGGLSVAAGTVKGDYYDSNGVHYFIDTSVSATPIIIGAGVVDLNGLADALVLDLDGDTSISAPTDDQIDIEINGADKATFTESLLRLANATHFSSDTTTQRVINGSGVSVAVNDIGHTRYSATNGVEFLLDVGSTPASAAAACVVVEGGANGAEIIVSNRGRYVLSYSGTAPAKGELLILSTTAKKVVVQAYMSPEVIAVAMAAGAGGTVDALLLTQRIPYPFSSSNNLFQISGGSTSNFVATINGAPSGSTVTYNAPSSGAEDAIVPSASTQLAKLVLHNTTRGTSAYISSVNTGTNVITLTDTVPAAWANGDTITVRSQTNTFNFGAGAAYMFDLAVTSTEIPALATALVLFYSHLDTSAANRTSLLHPYIAHADPKDQNLPNQVTSVNFNIGGVIIPLINSRFTHGWVAGAAASHTTTLSVTGIWVAAP